MNHQIAAVQSAPDPARVTDGRRQIETELMRESGDRLRRRRWPEDSLRGVARQDLHDRKDDQRGEEERRDEESDPLSDVEQHRASRLARPRHSRLKDGRLSTP